MKSATQVTVAGMGVLMGLAGLEHGIGEILQGNRAPEGLVFASWPDAPFFALLGGEPAMSVIPNLLVSGILASLLSLAALAWATFFIGRKHGGLVLIGLSVLMLLVGAGFGPPLLGIILGLAGERLGVDGAGSGSAKDRTVEAVAVSGLRGRLGKLWGPAFGLCLTTWLLLMPGISVLGYFLGVEDAGLVMAIIASAFGTLGVVLLTAWARDGAAQRRVNG